MLTCVPRSKQPNDDDESNLKDNTPAAGGKQPMKRFGSQIKDMALKASGAYRSCTPCTAHPSIMMTPPQKSNDEESESESSASVSERFRWSYRRTGSKNSGSGRLKGISIGDMMSDSGRRVDQSVVLIQEIEPKQWVAQVEPGVLITFISLPRSTGNHLKQIRFRYSLPTPSTHAIYYCDNLGASQLSANLVFHSRMKRLDIAYHFISEQVQLGTLRVAHVSTTNRLADPLTKPLSPDCPSCRDMIRIIREMFNQWQAQRWWQQNFEKVMELYNVQKLSRQAFPLPTTLQSEDEEPALDSRSLKIESVGNKPLKPTLSNERQVENQQASTVMSSDYDSSALTDTPKVSSNIIIISGTTMGTSSITDPSTSVAAAASSLKEAKAKADESVERSISNDNEWVEEDEPGVYITIRLLPCGSKELRRVRFSREKYGEVHARLWWEENRARVHKHYL